MVCIRLTYQVQSFQFLFEHTSKYYWCLPDIKFLPNWNYSRNAKAISV